MIVLVPSSDASDVLISVLNVEYFGIISSVIDNAMVRGMVHWCVPCVVYGPGTFFPHSHLFVILNGWSCFLWCTDPVHDLVVIGGVIDLTSWPLLVPVSITDEILIWDTHNLRLEVGHVMRAVVVMMLDS
jgi:hypothetical protein